MKVLELIQSLDNKEHKKVKEYLQNTNNNVLYRFYGDLLNNKEKILQQKNKNILAYRLEQIILDVLAQSNFNNRYFEMHILKIIIEIEILYRRNLFTPALKRVKQANKLLDNYEITYYRLIINRWESILRKEMPVSASEDLTSLSELWSEAKKISTKQIPESIDIRFRTYYNLLLSRYRLENEKFTKFQFKKDVVENIETLKGENWVLAINNNAFIYFSSQQYKKALELFKELTAYYESFDLPHKLFPNEYFITLNNLMLTAAICGKYNKVEIIKNKLYGFYKNNFSFDLQLFMVTESYLLSIYCEINDIQNGFLIAKKIKNKYKKYEKLISPAHKFLLLFNMSLIYFLMDDNKNSLYWIMKIIYSSINKKKSVYLSNIYYYSYFLYCLNHFEMQHFGLLQEQKDKILVTLSKIRPVKGVELQLIEKLCSSSVENYRTVLKELKSIDFSGKQITQFINVNQWLASKLSDQSNISF